MLVANAQPSQEIKTIWQMIANKTDVACELNRILDTVGINFGLVIWTLSINFGHCGKHKHVCGCFRGRETHDSNDRSLSQSYEIVIMKTHERSEGRSHGTKGQNILFSP